MCAAESLKFLLSGQDQLYGSLAFSTKGDSDRLQLSGDLSAEPASDHGIDHSYFTHREAKEIGHIGANIKWPLAVAPNRDFIRRVLGKDRMRFHVAVMDTGTVEGILQNHISQPKSRRNIALAKFYMACHVAIGNGLDETGDIRALLIMRQLLMDSRRVLPQGLTGVEDRGELLIFHPDSL